MKIRTALSLFVFLALSSIVMAQGRNEVRYDGYQGQVKNISSVMYEAVTDGDQMQRGDVLERIQIVYNSKGQRKSMTYLSPEEDNIIFRTRYKHDAFGYTTLEHVVDNAEHVIGRTYYIYNAQYALTETYVEDVERQCENRMLYRYDEQGRLSQRSFNDDLNNVYKREVYTYSFDGNILKTVVYDRSGNKMQELRYEYDSHNQPTNETLYDYTEEEPEVFVTMFRYQYDSMGNWIQKTEYSLDGDRMTAQYITERTIEYF